MGRAERVQAGLPEGIRVYATGDVDGRADRLDEVFAPIDLDSASRPGLLLLEVFVGDYVDRRANSKSNLVIEHLIRRSRSRRTVFLKAIVGISMRIP
jgi:serine/threonine protein phosphatase 1